jgi:ribose 5-phosphate isomerase RpiB
LSFGARFIDEKNAMDVAKLWLETPFTAELRHLRRLKKIEKLFK